MRFSFFKFLNLNIYQQVLCESFFLNSVYDALGAILRWWIASGEYFYNRRLIGVSLLFLLTTFNFAERTFAIHFFTPPALLRFAMPKTSRENLVSRNVFQESCNSLEISVRVEDSLLQCVCVVYQGFVQPLKDWWIPLPNRCSWNICMDIPTQRSRLRARHEHVSTVWTFDSSP